MAVDQLLRSTVHERRLANGLTVLIAEDRRAPVVAVITHVRAGYFDEADDEVGISHVLEHMFFKGTARRGPGDMGRETKELGGYLNAGTIYDRTSYYTVVPSSAWARALDIQADALQNSVIDADELAKELRVIIEEAKRKLDSPGAVARESLYEAMFDRHRMRRWRIGKEEELARLTRDDVMRFYRRMYSAPNVILSVAGDVDAGELFDQIEALYGGMPAAAPARDRGPAEPEHSGFRFREMAGDLRQTHMEWGWRTCGPLDDDSPAVDLFGVLLGQGRASRLYRGVRETGLVTGIGAYHYTPEEIGVFGIGAVGTPAQTHAALTATVREVRAAAHDGFRAEEIERAKNMLEARIIRRFETVDGQATLLAEWQALGDWRRFEAYVDRLMRIGPEDLAHAAERYLSEDKATVLVYRPMDSEAVRWVPAEAGTLAASPPVVEPVTAFAIERAHGAWPAAEGVEDGVHRYDLPGLRIIVLPRREVPLVTMALAWTGGSVEEPPADAGLSGLMTRTALKGTVSRNAAQLAVAVESLGGSISPGTTSDMFEWIVGLPSRHMEAGLELLADAALNAVFPATELERECKAALSEIQLLREDMQSYPLRLLFETAFAGDAYGQTLEAVEAMLGRAERGLLEAWHRRTVRERKATLFMVGDVEPDTAAAAGARLVSGLGTGERALPASPVWPETPRQHVIERATAQSALAIGFPGPPRGHADADALYVMSAAIGGLGGPLFEELRSRRSLAYTVSASLVARQRAGVFIGYIGTSPDREEEARAGLLEQLGRMGVEPLTEADVERARRYLIGSRQIRLQTNGARLGELAGAILLGRGLEELRDFEQRIRAVTPERIREAAARWLDTGRTVEAVVRGTGVPALSATRAAH